MLVLILEPHQLVLWHVERAWLHLCLKPQNIRLGCSIERLLRWDETINPIIGICTQICIIHKRVIRIVLWLARIDIVIQVRSLLRSIAWHSPWVPSRVLVSRLCWLSGLALNVLSLRLVCRELIHLCLLCNWLLLLHLAESLFILLDFLFNVLILLLVPVGSIYKCIYALHVYGTPLLSTELLLRL